MDATATINPPATATLTAVRSWSLGMTLVLGLAGVLFLARLGERGLWSEEMRWAEIPREMVQSGNYLWPTINGKTYYDKPLGSYWLVIIASWITGEINETSARLPSATFGLIGVAFAMLIARRLYNEPTAILTGVILATSFSFAFFARTASADIETVAGVLAVLWVHLRNEERPAHWRTLLLWLLMALTSLTKGLLGFVLPILIIGLHASLTPAPTETGRGWIMTLANRNRWVFQRITWRAAPLSILVYLCPFLASMAAEGSTAGLDMVYRENLRRFFDPVNHRGPIYLYFYVIFLLLAPWSLLLPAAIWHAHTSSSENVRGRRFALAYFWGTFIFFTLSSSRRSYYLLPILPAGAFLIGRLLAEREELARWTRRLLRAGFFALAGVALVSLAALVPASWLLPAPWDNLPPLPCPWLFALAWLVSVASVGWALRRLAPGRIGTCTMVITTAFMFYLYLLAIPATETYRTQRPFADSVRAQLGPHCAETAIFRTRDLVYYLGQSAHLAEYHTPEELRDAIDAGRLRWLILRRRDWKVLALSGTILLGETVHPWERSADADSKLLLVEVGKW